MSAERPINPLALAISDAATLLSKAGGRLIRPGQIAADIAAGAPTNSDGQVNLVTYAAWMARERRERSRGDLPPAAQAGWDIAKRYWETLVATDFTTVEVWKRGGLVTFYLLFVMELKTRRVHLAGCTADPHEAWMIQFARNLTDSNDGFLICKTHLLMDRDTKFSAAFRDTLQAAGVKPVLLPPRSPNLNAYQERFFLSLKSESLDRMIFFGEESLRRGVREYLAHYCCEPYCLTTLCA